MSNRSGPHGHQPSTRGGYSYRPKTQMKFVPKSQNSPSPNPNPNPNPTLSSSLRQPHSGPTRGAQQKGRVRLGENGEWVSSKTQGGGGGRFVNYLPQDEAVAVGLGADQGGLDPVESQRVVDLLNRELARLLKLRPRDFWRQAAADASLHEFLDSFLQFRSRWYDFPYHGAKGIVAGVIVGDLELSHRVFMVLYRISSNRDPGAPSSDSLSQKDHGALLQEKKLLDLPKLLDVCALYGHENEDLTRSLVLNAINAQPGILNSFAPMMSHLLGIVQTMYQRCNSSLETLISAGGCDDHGANRLQKEYLEVMDFLNDAVVSMDAFVNAYRPAAVFFSCPVDASHGNEELINVLATLHDSLLPSLLQGLRIIFAAEQKTTSSLLSDVSASMRILSGRIVDLGWRLLDNCYLSDGLFKDNVPFPATMKMFPATVEEPLIRTEILIQTFKEIAAVPQQAQGKNYRGTYLQNIDKKHQMMERIQNLQNSGWLLIDGEQYQYLVTMMTHPAASIPKKSESLNAPPTSARGDDGMQHAEDTAIVESKISQVRDLFPDYGKGFISACLEVYDHNPEEVIQRILEGTLHEDLLTLDTSMETVPPKSTPAPPAPKKDKGKGILVVEPTAPVPQKPRPEPITSSSSSSSSSSAVAVAVAASSGAGASSMPSSVGRFVRKSKDGAADVDTLDSKDEKHMEKTAALMSQYEYEDEYDDSFDDLGMTVVGSGVEETEILGERMNIASSRGETQSTQSSSGGNSRWGSKKKPQYYVKDGKNYSYKVEGAIAVADERQATLVNQAQKEMIHGLGRGGNLPMGAVRRLEDQNNGGEDGNEADPTEGEGEGGGRGRGRERGRGGRGFGRSNHYRKDRAMRKHMAGVGGF